MVRDALQFGAAWPRPRAGIEILAALVNDFAYTVSVIVSNCYLPTPIEIGPDARVVQLPTPLGFRGETDYMIDLCQQLGVPFSPDFPDQLRSTIADTQHVAIIQVRGVTADSPEAAELEILDWIDQVCDMLSVVTTNAATPIAYLMSPDGQRAGTSVRLLPPPESKILLGYHDARRTLEGTENDPAYAVLCRVFRIAQQARRPDFRIFHYGQLLELASEDFKGKYLRHRIHALLKSLDLPPTQFPPLDGLASDADGAHALANLRNAMAHRGALTRSTVHPKFHALLSDLDALAYGIRELVRAVLASMAVRLAQSPSE